MPVIETGWLPADDVLTAERAIASRTALLLVERDKRWDCDVTDLGSPGTVRLVTKFEGEVGPVIRVHIDTMPEHAAKALHDHFVQPVREAARQRRLASHNSEQHPAAASSCSKPPQPPQKCRGTASKKPSRRSR